MPSGAGSDSIDIHILDDGPCDPAWNMAVDDALLHLRQQDAISGTWVRLFGWSPPAVSIGRLQSPAEELDFAALRVAGVPVVRRSTGGKAVFHANELTYSLVAGVPDPTWGANLHETYRRVTAVISDALAEIGVETNLASGRPERGADSPLAAACFAVAYGHELLHLGRKICGSAQRRLTRAFLQHGSLLLGPEQSELAHFLRTGGDRMALAASLRAETVDASSALGRQVGPEELVTAVREVLVRRFGPLVKLVGLPETVRREALARIGSVRVSSPEDPGVREPPAIDREMASG